MSSSASDVEDGDAGASLMEGPASAPGRSCSGFFWQVSGALSATFGGLLMGLTLAYTSTALPSIESDPGAPQVTSAEASLIGAAVPLGALVGGLAAGPLAQRVGQRAVMILSTLPALAGWLVMAYARDAGTLVAGRVLTGAVAGSSSAIITGFVGETVGDEVRGALGASFQLMVTVGVLLSYTAGRWLAWRWLATVGALLTPLWALGLVLLATESPAWLVSRHRVVDADRALRRLRGGADTADELARVTERVRQSASVSGGGSTWMQLGRRQHRRPLLMMLALMFLQQLSGVNAVIFYTKQIFQAAGAGLAPGDATVLVGAVQVGATLLSVLLVDRAGRRALLLVSELLMGVCLLALGVFFWLKAGGREVDGLGWLPLSSLLLFILAFSVGLGPIPWLMLGELFSPEVAGVAAGLATAFNWGLAFLVTLLFEPVRAAIGLAATFWVFSATCLLGAGYVYRQVVETRGRTLHEIAEHFQR